MRECPFYPTWKLCFYVAIIINQRFCLIECILLTNCHFQTLSLLSRGFICKGGVFFFPKTSNTRMSRKRKMSDRQKSCSDWLGRRFPRTKYFSETHLKIDFSLADNTVRFYIVHLVVFPRNLTIITSN